MCHSMFMAMKIFLWFLTLCVLVSTPQASFSTSSAQFESAVSDMVISKEQNVFVATANEIQVLDNNFSLESIHSIVVASCNITAISLNLNGTRLIVCLQDGSCTLYDTADFSVIRRYTRLSNAARNYTLVTVPSSLGDSFIIGSSAENEIVVEQYGFDNDNRIQRSSFWDFAISNESFYNRDFFTTFYIGNYTYFVVVDKTAFTSTSGIKILRVCNIPSDTRFNALYEVGLECGTPSVDVTLTSVDLIVSKNGMSVVLGLTAADHLRFCNISIADIDRQMQGIFNACIEGTEYMTPPWIEHAYADDCSQFTKQDVSECNFGSLNSVILIRVLAAQENIELTPFFQLNTEQKVITTTLSIVADDAHLLFIGYSNDSGYFLAKYTAESGALVVLLQTPRAISILKWRNTNRFITAATLHQVHTLPLEECSSSRDCASCSESPDPLCGWCSLESKCSRKAHCSQSTLHNRWIQERQFCVSEIVVPAESVHLSVDSIMNVTFSLSPKSSSLPELIGSEALICQFDANRTEESVYSFSVPYTNGVCVLKEFPTFEDSSISLSMSLVYPLLNTTVVTANTLVSLHNCSTQSTSCSQCVTSSQVCGWCTYNHSCTGSSSNCRHPSDQTALLANHSDTNEDSFFANFIEECPAILQPDSGVYIHPIGVSQALIVRTQSLPPFIPGYQYFCSVEYSNGRSVRLPVSYWSSSQVYCVFAAEKLTGKGVEGVHLTLLWADTEGAMFYSIDEMRPAKLYQFDSPSNRDPPPPPVPPNMVLYNCSAFDSSCTYCLAANINTGFACGWCSGTESSGRCAVAGSCTDTSFARSATYCPEPAISSLTPSSGPTQGGTVVSIIGTNLGVRVQDVKEILFGSTSCALDQSGYISGTQVVCTTSGSNSDGLASVEIHIQNGNRSWIIHSEFQYAIPTIYSVSPTYGPVSGGTTVAISGTALDISSPNLTVVIIAGAECDIQYLTSSEIMCITSRASSPLRGFVLVQIDYSRTTGAEFVYTNDPEFFDVHPQQTILAGGVKLLFMGNYLNVSANPVLVFYLTNGSSLRKTCTPSNSTNLVCTAPDLTGTQYDSTADLNSAKVNYTLVFDNAAGPSINEAQLTLYIKSNPVFTQIHNEDRNYMTGSLQGIRILGRNINSVLPSELTVTIASEDCVITAVTPDIIYCNPPDVLLTSSSGVEVTVCVANGSLTYNVGFLHYTTERSDNNLLDVWMFVVIVVAGVLLLAVIMLIVVACILVAKKRTSPPASHSSALETAPIANKEFLHPLSPINYYNQSAGGDDNFYEAIPDMGLEFNTDKFNNPSTATLNSGDNCYENEDDEDRSTNTSSAATNRSRVLPPLPISEEYIEMGSHSVSSNNGSEENDANLVQFPVAAPDGKSSPVIAIKKSGPVYVHMVHAADEQCMQSSMSGSIADSCHSSEQYVDMKQGSQLSM